MFERDRFISRWALCVRVSAALMALCVALLAAPATYGKEAARKETSGEVSAREKRLRQRELQRENEKAELEWTNAESAFLVNDYDTARKLYLTIIRLYPTSDYALRALARVGDVYRAQKQFLQAIEFYRKVVGGYARLEREQQDRLEELLVRVRYMIGATYYDQKNFRLAFGELRAFIQDFPDSKYANVAYFLIGQSHLVNKNYRAALRAFESVGTAQGVGEQARKTVIAPGGTLYIQVRDPDMRTAAQGQMVKIQLKTTRGDMETLLLKPKGIGSDVFVSNIKTRLGSPQPTTPLEGMWSEEVDTELNRSLRMASELVKRVEELEAERETAKNKMVRISKDPNLPGDSKLEAVSKQKQLVTRLSKNILDSKNRAKIEREKVYSRIDAAYSGIEAFLAQVAPDQTIETIEKKFNERLQAIEEARDEGASEEEQEEKKKEAEKETFTEEEILEMRKAVVKDATTENTFERRRTVLRYWMDRLLHDLKRLEVVGTDEITVYYKDDHVTSGQGPIIRQDKIGLAANGFIGYVAEDLKGLVTKVIYTSGVFVQVVDFDQDTTDAKDSVQAVLSVIPRPRPEEERAKGEGEGKTDENAEESEPQEKKDEEDNKRGGAPRYIGTYVMETEYKVIEKKTAEGTSEKVIVEVEEEENPPLVPEGAPNVTITLEETEPHSGVFVAAVKGTPRGVEVGGKEYPVSQEQQLRAAYNDKINIARRKPWVVWSTVEFAFSYDSDVVVPDPVESKLNRRAQLEKGISEAELAKVYEDLGLADRAGLFFERALRTCAEVAQVEGITPMGEEATHAIWRILLESGQTREAIRACRQLVEEFPDSNLVDDAYLIIGQAYLKQAQQADDRKKMGLAMQAFSAFGSLELARPKSEYVPEAIYSMGLAKFVVGEGGTAMMERVVKEYPDSSFAALALEKSGTYAYRNRDFAGAYEYFTRILTDYPDAKDLDKILFARGHCKVKMRQHSDALRAYYELVETYPGSPYSKKAQKLIAYLKKAMKKQESK